jgi:formylglycine-generating enzyme required for sulfatase activity
MGYGGGEVRMRRILWTATVVLALGSAWRARLDAAPAEPAMMRVPAGKFFMGDRPSDGRDGHVGRPVTLGGFAIDATEVTVRDYLGCVAAGGCPAISSKEERCNVNLGAAFQDHPVNCVEWGAAAAFCRWRGKRLPSSAEWERAARGDDERKYPWGGELPRDQLCWRHERQGGEKTCPVGAHPAGVSPFGLLDMAGNVAEWTATRVPTPFGMAYVVRGGGYAVDDIAMAAPDDLDYRADREVERDPTDAALDLGFRCVKGDGSAGTHGAAAREPERGPELYVFTPPPGTRDRKAVMEVVRASLRSATLPKADWLKLSGDWAYVEAKVERPGGTPAVSSVNALLRRNPDGHWEAAELLIGPESESRRADFRARLEAQRARAKLPPGLFWDP